MLLEKSSLNHFNLEMITNYQILLVDLGDFDIEVISKEMLIKKIKFVVINHGIKCAILSAIDILALRTFKESVFDYINRKDKIVDALSIKMEIGIFLDKYENEKHRYYSVYKNKEIVGIVDKNEVIHLYTEVDNENNALITSILDNINDAVCIVDNNCKVKFWNKSAEKLYQLSRKVIIDEKLTDYFPTALLPKVLKDKKRVINVYNQPRENCHNLISASPLYANDLLIGAISYDKDISEQIKIAESLKETESNLNVLKNELINIGEERYSFDSMIGSDPNWLEVVKLTKMMSKSMINILISGESGTGKEVLARAIHVESHRQGLFVPINCSAIPRDLVESELFGYESGAFSGASTKGKIGKFEFANKGTIFLDEIGDMPIEVQAKLLRVLEEREITRVGGNTPIKIDVRIIAASNKNLLELSDNKEFRKDLYFRLNGVGVNLSPLRERPGDISSLALKFFEDFKTLYKISNLSMPIEILSLLEKYHWEGNIRELKNIIERTVILSKNNGYEFVSDRFLPDVIRDRVDDVISKQNYSLNELLERTEKSAIVDALRKTSSKAEASKLLKIPRSTLYFKMDKYKLH